MNNQNMEIEMKNLFYVFSLPKRIGLMFILPLMVLAHIGFAQAADTGPVKFDHIRTGYNLTGAHILVRCESCHVQGVFKGTPRDCATCHMAGNRLGATAKPSQHISTTAPCESCHRTTGWTPASYSHAGVAPGACMTCHNGTMATNKPSGHVLTTESCDKCHRTTAWIPAGYNHSGVAPGTCMTCHGVTATGKPNDIVHSSQTASCDTCHRTTAWLPTSYNHTGVAPGTCATCHYVGNTVGATTQSAKHVPTTASCDSCHTTKTWLGASNHSGVIAGLCATCHNGTTAKGVGGSATSQYPKVSGHVPTTLWPSCDACHRSTTTFASTRVHGVATNLNGNCQICHAHHNNSQSCDKCHSTSTWNN
jgi:hypothetical protein